MTEQEEIEQLKKKLEELKAELAKQEGKAVSQPSAQVETKPVTTEKGNFLEKFWEWYKSLPKSKREAVDLVYVALSTLGLMEMGAPAVAYALTMLPVFLEQKVKKETKSEEEKLLEERMKLAKERLGEVV